MGRLPTSSNQRLGRDGETIAVAFLRAKGASIIACNWRPGFAGMRGEIDIIAQSGEIARVLSDSGKVSTLKMASDIAKMCGCVAGLPEILGAIWSEKPSLENVAQKTFRITVKQFMDAHTFHDARIKQCCVHSGTFEDDPKRHSFCWRWLFDDATDFN